MALDLNPCVLSLTSSVSSVSCLCVRQRRETAGDEAEPATGVQPGGPQPLGQCRPLQSVRLKSWSWATSCVSIDGELGRNSDSGAPSQHPPGDVDARPSVTTLLGWVLGLLKKHLSGCKCP